MLEFFKSQNYDKSVSIEKIVIYFNCQYKKPSIWYELFNRCCKSSFNFKYGSGFNVLKLLDVQLYARLTIYM